MKNIILLILVACVYTIIAVIGSNAEITITQINGLIILIIITICSYLVTKLTRHIFIQLFLFFIFFICISSWATLDEVSYGFWQDIISTFLSSESLSMYTSPISPILPIFLGILIGGFFKIHTTKFSIQTKL